ncbi:MAG TPA: hypothetical protein VMA13_03870, partial [Candidatus Saccharimonadales bacterium]|nr:hypothetical protein [Candidatus Saccharimonadales bacterium]
MKIIARKLLILLCLPGFLAGVTVSYAGKTIKPAKTVLHPGQDATRVAVKFRDGLNVRLRNNHLVSTNAASLAAAQALLDSLSAG